MGAGDRVVNRTPEAVAQIRILPGTPRLTSGNSSLGSTKRPDASVLIPMVQAP